MPSSLLLSQENIVHQSESAVPSSTAIRVPSHLRVVARRTDPFEKEGQLLSDRLVDLHATEWSALAADAAHTHPQLTVSPWIAHVFDSVQMLLHLTEDWDSHGANPLAIKSIENLIILLPQGIPWDVPAPSVVPTVSGGIQLEWHRQGIDLEIEIPPSGRLCSANRSLQTA